MHFNWLESDSKYIINYKKSKSDSKDIVKKIYFSNKHCSTSYSSKNPKKRYHRFHKNIM